MNASIAAHAQEHVLSGRPSSSNRRFRVRRAGSDRRMTDAAVRKNVSMQVPMGPVIFLKILLNFCQRLHFIPLNVI